MYAVLIKCLRKLTAILSHSFCYYYFSLSLSLSLSPFSFSSPSMSHCLTFECKQFVLFLCSHDYTSIIVSLICICMRWQLSINFLKEKKNKTSKRFGGETVRSSEEYKSSSKSYEHMLLLNDWDETWVAFACGNNYSSHEALSVAKAHGICCFIE